MRLDKWITFAATATALSLSISAHAQNDEEGSRSVAEQIGDRFYVSPMASYVFADSDRGTDDGLGGTLLLGKLFQERFGAELEFHYSQNDPEIGGDDAKLLSGGLRGVLFPLEGANVYVTAGLGYGRFEDHPGLDPEYETILWTVGGGYLFGPFNAFLKDLAIRTELVFRADMHSGDRTSETFNNSLNELVASVGLLLPIGSVPEPPPPPPPPPVAVVPVAAPVDSDGDGITDDLDDCPDTPAGTEVDAKGCPPPPPPEPECEEPQPGQPISLDGCDAGDKIVLRGVNFEFDRAALTANATTILDSVVTALNSVPDVRIEVGGHTDSRGSDAYNQRLSDQRAASVVQYLASKGIDRSRMESSGYGEAEPVDDNDTDEGREQNRRVELKIID